MHSSIYSYHVTLANLVFLIPEILTASTMQMIARRRLVIIVFLVNTTPDGRKFGL
jgi:hypothetical protein